MSSEDPDPPAVPPPPLENETSERGEKKESHWHSLPNLPVSRCRRSKTIAFGSFPSRRRCNSLCDGAAGKSGLPGGQLPRIGPPSPVSPQWFDAIPMPSPVRKEFIELSQKTKAKKLSRRGTTLQVHFAGVGPEDLQDLSSSGPAEDLRAFQKRFSQDQIDTESKKAINESVLILIDRYSERNGINDRRK